MPKTFLLKKNFHNNICRQLLEDIQYKRSNYYYYLGKLVDTDAISDTLESEMQSRAELITFKKVMPSDVSFVTRRINWETGVIFDQYDSSIDLTDKNFYVLTDTYNVYKCLHNNGGVPSTEMPVSTSLFPVTMSDGYVWKFMYSTPPYKVNKFLSALRMPVQTILSDTFYSTGAIAGVTITNPGSGYDENVLTTITTIGDGTGLVLTPVIYNGELAGVQITNPGTGYTYATATVYSDTGSGATVVIDISDNNFNSSQTDVEQTAVDGAIYNIVVPTGQGGIGYTIATVAITGDGVDATATATIVNGVITKINVVTVGRNYSNATVTINGNGTGATAYAILTPIGGHGKDAVNELLADTVCIYSNIRSTPENIQISQDFREYGIIRNLRDLYSGKLISSNIGDCTYTVELNTAVDIVKDEVLKYGTSRFRVVDINGKTAILTSINNDALTKNMLLSAETNEVRTYQVMQLLSLPNADKYSGQMLFVSNSDAFTFTDEQQLTIKTYIKL